MAYPMELRSGDGVIAFDAQLAVVGWNDAAERLTGLAASDVLGRPCWEVLGATDPSGNLVCHSGCWIARACRERTGVSTAMLMIRSNGGRRAVRLSTISLVCDGEQLHLHVFSEATTEGLGSPQGIAAQPTVPVTRRQLEVLTLLAEGLSTEEIASRLTVSRATVRNHVRAILAALDCHSRLEAVARGRALGLV